MSKSSETYTRYDALVDALRECTTVTDLFKLAASDEFRAESRSLTPDNLDRLRQTYRECQTALDGKVKLEQFDSTIIRIIGVDWWHSDTWDNDGVSLQFIPENDTTHKYKALTSSATILRFCNRFANKLPSPDKPVRVFIKLLPVRDPERAAKGQKQWTIKELPTVDGITTGSPF